MPTIDLPTRFGPGPEPDERQKLSLGQMQRSVYSLALGIDTELADCREKSIGLTKLEEALHWFELAILRN